METKPADKKYAFNFFDSAIITLIASALLFVLSYSFNCGYNNYFGIPLMFSNANWGGIVYRIPQLSNIIFLIAMICLIISITTNIFKIVKKEKKQNEDHGISKLAFLVIAVLVLLEAAVITIAFLRKEITSIVLSFVVALLLAVMSIVFFKIRKTEIMTKRLKDNIAKAACKQTESNNYTVGSELSEITKQTDHSIKLLEIWPKSRALKISSIFSAISLLFLLFFFWGMISAYNQTSFCFIDNSRVIVATSETNVIVINTKYNSELKRFENQYKYEILPQENLAFYIIDCGRIFSNVKVDNRAWSFRFN